MRSFNGRNLCIEIEYEDSEGVVTQRRINLHKCYQYENCGPWYLEGFCHNRREDRTFRSDRIRKLWDGSSYPSALQTLNCMRHPSSLVKDINNWAENLWLFTPAEHPRRFNCLQKKIEYQKNLEAIRSQARLTAEVESIVDQHFHALRALIYVAKADKAFRATERRIFTFFFKRVAGHRMDTPQLEELCIKRAFQIDTPSTGQFHYSIRHLIPRLRTYRMAVCASAQAMVNSDKKVHDYEKEVIAYMVKKLKPLED